jgi:hypothetical protein
LLSDGCAFLSQFSDFELLPMTLHSGSDLLLRHVVGSANVCRTRRLIVATALPIEVYV